jgi:uncharacterized protein HemX
MKLTHLVLIAGVALGVGAQVQAQDTRREDRDVARLCKADAEKMCSGKTGQELQQCLKSNQQKLSSNCKDAVSKLPNAPKS